MDENSWQAEATVQEEPQPVKSELAAVGKSSVSGVKQSPGLALPGAGSRMDLPSLRRRMNAREQSAALLDRGIPQAEISACDQHRSQL